MTKIIRVGVDLAKNVFHIHAVDENEKTVWQGKYNFHQLSLSSFQWRKIEMVLRSDNLSFL